MAGRARSVMILVRKESKDVVSLTVGQNGSDLGFSTTTPQQLDTILMIRVEIKNRAIN